MRIDRLDHLVLTVADVAATCRFYGDVLGMGVSLSPEGRTSPTFGTSKINLHPYGHEYAPHAERPTPGSADLCLVVDGDLGEVVAELGAAGVPVVEGPVHRAGATGTIRSVYVRDPDANLVELSTYR